MILYKAASVTANPSGWPTTRNLLPTNFGSPTENWDIHGTLATAMFLRSIKILFPSDLIWLKTCMEICFYQYPMFYGYSFPICQWTFMPFTSSITTIPWPFSFVKFPTVPTLLRSVFLLVMVALWDVNCGTRWDEKVCQNWRVGKASNLRLDLHSGKLFIAMENGPIWVDVFPIEDGDSPASYVNLPEGTWHIRFILFFWFCYCVRCVFSHKRSARTQTSCLQRKCSSARYIKPSHLEQVFDTWWCVNIQKHCFQGFQYPLHCISRPQATYWNRNAVMECI